MENIKNKIKKIGIIGCGNIGTEIARAVDKGNINVEISGCYDISKQKYEQMLKKLKNIRPEFMQLEDVIKSCDLAIECATKEAVRNIFEIAIKYYRDIIFLSAGGVLDCQDLIEEAKTKMINIYIPSGAVVGIDGLDAAKYLGIKQVTLITRKPPEAFKGNKYLQQKNIDPNKINVETVVFDGTAKEAINDFPANINVAATLSIAGIGPEKTKVKIIIDPFIKTNIHEIIVEGDFGRFRTITENLPSPENPKTSYLTSLSTIVLIKKIVEPIHIGT
ncbi:MAG: aspartate dehydrogenase [Candidatus Goldbacteria bacterium]|nr:aspartate dehydrogenase [Candidatus Goldiibacteriota bacterium]